MYRITSVFESPRIVGLAMWSYVDKALAGWPYKLLLSPPIIVYGKWFGGDGAILLAFYALFILDLAVGFIGALCQRRFCWRRVDLWVIKLLTYSLSILVFGAVNLAAMRIFNYPGMPILDVVISIMLVNEAGSILRGLSECGLPVPPVMLRVLVKLQGKVNRRLDDLLDRDDPEKPWGIGGQKKEGEDDDRHET